MLDAVLRPFPPVRAGARLLRELGAGELLRLARMLTLPARVLGRERFAGDGARALLAGSALHTDLGPDNAGSGVFGWLLTMLGQEVGFPVPEGGAGAITDALVRRLADRGGRVDCGRPVDRGARRRRRGGRASATAPGEPVRARRAVLADVPAPVLYRRPGRRGAPAGPAARRPRGLPLGRRHDQGRLGAVRADPVVGGGGRPGGHRAPRRRPRRAVRCRHRPRVRAAAARAVPAARPDDDRGPVPVAGRHRVGVGVHARAARPGVDARPGCGGGRTGSSR